MMSYFSNLSTPILGVVALLLGFSLFSWAIILWKWLQLRSATRDNRGFLEEFWKSRDLADAWEGCAGFTASPLLSVLNQIRRPSVGDDVFGRCSQGGDPIGRVIRDAVGQERHRLERYLGFLATTASVTPFIGLFGTVWGIMVAFNNIGAAGSTSLDIVAPGISEALVTTAIGLAAAIPASVGFNFLQERTQTLVGAIETFATDLDPLVRADASGSPGVGGAR